MKIHYNPKLKQLSRNLRNNSTMSEVLLWNELKGKQSKGYQFMRQKPIGNYIVDFFCSRLKLIIEIDGSSHYDEGQFKQDEKRQQELGSLGLNFLRFDDLEVKRDMNNVLRSIEIYIEQFQEKEFPLNKGG